NAGVLRIQGQSNLEFPIDLKKCATWNVSVADVQNVIQSAVGGRAITQITEGEKTYDLAIRWPERLRSDQSAILNIPVDITNHRITSGSPPDFGSTPLTGGGRGPSTFGTSVEMPTPVGTSLSAVNALASAPR